MFTIPTGVNDQVGLSGAHPILDGGPEFGRACHPVSSRQHVVCRKVRPSANDDPCGAGRSRLHDPHGYAYADGSREPSRGAGCSAGTCAYPWPPVNLLIKPDGTTRGWQAPPVVLLVVTGAVSGKLRTLPYRRLSGDRLRLLSSLAQVKPHRLVAFPRNPPTIRHRCKNLLTFTPIQAEPGQPSEPKARRTKVVQLGFADGLSCSHLWITMWTVPMAFPVVLPRPREIRP